MSKYDKAVGTSSKEATNSGKLPSIGAYLNHFSTVATKWEIAEAYLGIASKNVSDATRNGDRVRAITNNARKMAAEAVEIAKAMLSGSSDATWAGLDAELARAEEDIRAARKVFSEASKAKTPVTK